MSKKPSTKANNKPIYNRAKRSGRGGRIAVVVTLTVLVIALLALVAGLIVWVLMKQPQRTDPAPSGVSSAPTAAPTTRATLPAAFIDANVQSAAVVLYDATNDHMLYSKKAEERREPASLTKLIAAILAVKHLPEGGTFTVGNEIYMIDKDSSVANLHVGETLNLQTMLEALLIPSGNDAAYTIAVHIGRLVAGDGNLTNEAAVQRFVTLMNDTAKELGANNTHFSNPDGVHAQDHYTTAGDLLLIAKAALAVPPIAQTVKTPVVTTAAQAGQRVHTWKNSNALLQADNAAYYNEYATGLKTGSTDEAGYCLAASAEKDGRTLITILLGSPTDKGRWEDANGLLQLGFQNG